MDIIYSVLIYSAFIILTLVIVYFKKRLNISNSQLEDIYNTVELVNHLTSKFEFKYKDGVMNVLTHVATSIKYVEEFEVTIDIEKKKELIKEKALQICKVNNIELDSGIVEIVDEIVEKIIK